MMVMMVMMVMVMMMVMMVMMMMVMHCMSHRRRRGSGRLLSYGEAAEADGESGGDKEGLDHGKAVLLLIGPQRGSGGTLPLAA